MIFVKTDPVVLGALWPERSGPFRSLLARKHDPTLPSHHRGPYPSKLHQRWVPEGSRLFVAPAPAAELLLL